MNIKLQGRAAALIQAFVESSEFDFDFYVRDMNEVFGDYNWQVKSEIPEPDKERWRDLYNIALGEGLDLALAKEFLGNTEPNSEHHFVLQRYLARQWLNDLLAEHSMIMPDNELDDVVNELRCSDEQYCVIGISTDHLSTEDKMALNGMAEEGNMVRCRDTGWFVKLFDAPEGFDDSNDFIHTPDSLKTLLTQCQKAGFRMIEFDIEAKLFNNLPRYV